MKVEVIILPILPKKAYKAEKLIGLKDLQTISIWSDNYIKAMEEASKKFSLWTIQNF